MPPVNDNFANRTVLVISGGLASVTGQDLTGATNETGEPHFVSGNGTIWYEITPTGDGLWEFTLTLDTADFAAITVFTGITVNALTEVNGILEAFNAGSTTKSTYNLVGGTAYKIQVTGDVNGGTFDLSVGTYQIPTGPTFDNIENAYELIQDNTQHTQDFDNTGASQETNEEIYINIPNSVWARLDLSNYDIKFADTDTVLTLQIEKISGTVIPWLKLYDADPNFDPATPDFNLLSAYATTVGDGTDTPPAVSFTLADVTTGVIYLELVDWNADSADQGVQRLTYTVQTLVKYDADASDWNTTSGTVTDLGGGVIKETQHVIVDSPNDIRGVPDSVWTFKISGAQLPPNGIYKVLLKAVINGPWVGFTTWDVYIRRNGESLLPYAMLTARADAGVPTSIDIWGMYDKGRKFGPLENGLPAYAEGPGPSTIPVLKNDVLEVIAYNNVDPYDNSWLEITGLRFVQIQAGGSSGSSIALATIPREAEGTNADARDDPTHETSITQKDMCILDNGDVYIVYFTNNPYNLKLKKWDGTAWSIISSDLSHAGLGTNYTPVGGAALPYGQISMDSDGTDIYIAWGETDYATSKVLTNFSGSTVSKNPRLWHVKKYTPGVGFTELGSGQCANPIANRTTSASTDGTCPDAGSYNESVQIKIAPNGVPWVIFAETTDQWLGSGGTFQKPYVYYWNGSAWVDTLLPDPPNVDMTNTQGGYVDFIKVDAQHQLDLTFCHHDGPSNYPAIVYSYGSFDTGRGQINQRFIYQEYNGTSWGNLLDKTSIEIWPGGTISTDIGGHGQQGMVLKNNGSVPILAAALWNGDVGSDFIKVAKIKADGTDWEPFTPELSAVDIGFRADRELSEGGWIDPSGCIMDIDGNGRLWAAYTGTEDDEYGLVVMTEADPGTSNYWIPASRSNYILYGEDFTGFSSLRVKGSTLYILGFWNLPSGSKSLSLFKAPINDPYSPWSSVTINTIIYYHKDGVWHPANTEVNRDLYYFSGGSWHKKGSELTQTVKAMSNESWTD